MAIKDIIHPPRPISKIDRLVRIIVNILKENEDARNSDILLFGYVWERQGLNEHIEFPDFFVELLEDRYSSPDLIAQIRWKLQNDYKELRGSEYNEIKLKEKEIRKLIKAGFKI